LTDLQSIQLNLDAFMVNGCPLHPLLNPS